jgi:arylsulfatase B/arylsulfatase I/J
LWDLSTDPTEGNNLLLSNLDIADDLKSKALEWISEIGAAETTDDTYKKKSWKAAGGVVPWLDDDSKRDIPILYGDSAKVAPNIVFVLVDDWGMNDVGYQSSYLMTPNIDKLASQGVKLTNYWTSTLCTPSRGALMTGKYPFRLGLSEKDDGELSLSEVTIAEEMKSAGYRTGMVGKWHLGFSSNSHTPLNRGFDTFYGFYNGFIDYWTKQYSNYLDLHNGYDLETDATLISSDLHNGYVISQKVEEAIESHATNYADQPLFLYVASQLIHEEWQAPMSFIKRCAGHETEAVQATYCAMNLMVDEFIANTTCALEKYGMADNTVLIVASDNGGERTMYGNSYPYRGGKGNYFRSVIYSH